MFRLTKQHDITAFASKDITRYNLTGVYLDAEQKVAVATDGHRMAIVPVDINAGDGGEACVARSAILESTAIKSAIKALPNKGDDMEARSVKVQQTKAMGATLQNCKTSTTAEETDGRFPDYRQVLPALKSDMRIGCNAKYLRDVCDYAIKHANNNAVTIYLQPEEIDKGALAGVDAKAPITIVVRIEETQQDATFVIMPMRL